ncbi:MAG: alanine racemase [Hellea sp.]|nr:alanine racemase [Hellea sp.]
MSEFGPNYSSRPVLRIDMAALKYNYNSLAKRVGPKTHVAAAVKADAYGLGAERISKALYGAGCRNFFVATSGEGKDVRAAIGDNASIYVLNGAAPRDLTLFFGSNLKPVINSMTQAHMWMDAIKNVKSPPFSALHIDTGINRLGFPSEEFQKFIKNKSLQEKIQFDLIMSHLACAPDQENPYNKQQLDAFKRAAAALTMKPMSLANSAGIYLGKQYHFQMVRPGIALYGGYATDNPAQEDVKPVVSLMAPVLQIRRLKKGDSLGYNATFTAENDMTVAIVGAGYADGIPVSASSGAGGGVNQATMQNKRVSVIGRVSMDLTALDVTPLKKTPRLGDWAEFFGSNLQDDAASAQTLNYELLIRLSHRARREYR